jgi:hypothetical protein
MNGDHRDKKLLFFLTVLKKGPESVKNFLNKNNSILTSVGAK